MSNPAYPQPYPNPGPGYYPPQDTRKHGGLATAALVLGIIGFVFACIPGVNFVAYPIVLLAIVFGFVALKWGKAKAGLILGILGLIATILWTVVIAGAFHKATKEYNTYNACISHATTTAQVDSCNSQFVNHS